MREAQYIAPTKRRSMTKARAAKIFLREQGRCYLCGIQIRAGADSYEIEHPEALTLGGADNDEDLRVVCTPCHKPKTASDRRKGSKRNNAVTSTWKGKPRKSRLIPGSRGSGFRKKMNGVVVKDSRW